VQQRLKLKASAILQNSSVRPPTALLPPKKPVFNPQRSGCSAAAAGRRASGFGTEYEAFLYQLSVL
jgi:hypothetical protein